MNKILVCFGTRPEIIKLSPLIQELSKKFEVLTLFTGQHSSLFDDVKHLIPNINILMPSYADTSLAKSYSRLQENISNALEEVSPDLVIVQGDTSSAYAAALSAFLMGIKVGHVEAGLRTNDIASPFPEEFNRQMISKIAYYNWCPSELAAENLIKENVYGKIIVTGNTIVDMIIKNFDISDITYNKDIIITLHRRENKELFLGILKQIKEISETYPEFNFIFPVHPNPIIRNQLDILLNSNVKIIEPMKYEPFIGMIKNCLGIISDSGGIQEEAVCFKKRVLVCRSNTERMEGVKIGACRLVGGNIKDNFEWLINIDKYPIENPYGDGRACEKITDTIE